MNIGIVGDFHFPDRSKTIPRWVWERLSPCSLILSPGDFTSRDVLTRLVSFAPLHAVKGNMDFLDLPERKKVEVRGWRVGIVHGSGIHPRGDTGQLLDVARAMDVDILVHGHTHRLDMRTKKGILFLNPGSACGVWSGGGMQAPPSMILLMLTEEAMAEGIENGVVTQKFGLKKGGKVPEESRAQE